MDFLKGARERLFNRISGKDEKKLTKIKTEADQPEEERKLVAFVREKLEEYRTDNARVAHEAVWLTNIAYQLGVPAYWDKTSNQFRLIEHAVRMFKSQTTYMNMIMSRAQNRLARLCKNPPRYDVIPEDSSQDSRDTARRNKYILTSQWRKHRIDKLRIEVKNWCQAAGHAYFKVRVDPFQGPMMLDPETEKPVRAGDLGVEVVSPFEVFPNPRAKSDDDWTDCIHARVRDMNYFKANYERGHLVKPETTWLSSLQYLDRVNAMNAQVGSYNSGSKQAEDSAIEISYYEAPCPDYPKGRHVIVAGGVLLKDGPLPGDPQDEDGQLPEIPLIKFDDIKVPGKFYSEAVITHARPLQDQYNKLLAQRSRWTDRLIAGKYTAAKGTGIKREAMTDDSGEVVLYRPVPNAVNGGRPEPIQIPNIPQYVYEEESRLEQKLDEIFGINEVSRGQLPSASIPAIGMQFLVEQDDTRIGIMTESDEYAFAKLGRIILKFIQATYTVERMVDAVGEDLAYTFRKYSGQDIRSHFNVYVVRGSTLPGSKVLRRQEIMNLHQQGYLGDPMDPKIREQVLGMLEYGELFEAWKGQSLTDSQFKRNIEKIKQGTLPYVHEADMHPVLWKKYNEFRISEKFDQLEPQSQEYLLTVMEQHLRHMVNLTMPQTEEMEAEADTQEVSHAAEGAAAEVLAAEGEIPGINSEDIVNEAELFTEQDVAQEEPPPEAIEEIL